MKRLVLASACLFLGGVVLGQGSDSCSGAQSISGLGPHAFDNTGATLDGMPDCDGKNAFKDVWFEWTAPQSGGYVIRTCGTSSISVRIVIYEGTACPATTVVGCGSSGCIFDTRFSFPTTAGQDYLIRVGGKTPGTAGTGTFELVYDPCWLTADDGFEDNDECGAAVPVGDGTYPGLEVFKKDKDWFRVDVPDGATITIDALFLHNNGDISTWLYDGCGGAVLSNGGSVDDNETVTWDNNTGTCKQLYYLVEVEPNDPNHECAAYDMVVTGSAAPGTCGPATFCNPSDGSSNNVATIAASGSDLSQAITVDLAGGPPNQFTYLLIGDGNVKVSQPPGAKGDLCVVGGGCLGRYSKDIGAIAANGTYATDISNSVSGGANYGIPTCGGNIQAGDTWYFQYWHRQPMGQPSTFSEAVGVTFQ